MNHARWFGLLWVCLWVSPGAHADDITLDGAPPVVVKTAPQAGAKGVDPSLRQIKVTFSKEMADGSWSWSTVTKDSFPKVIGTPRYEADQRTCVVNVELQPNKTYGVWLNSSKYTNFKDAQGRSAVPYLLVFKTSEGGADGIQSNPRPPRSARRGLPPGAVLLSHVDDSAEGKQSYADSGHAVRFERPADASSLVAVEVFGSRYGYPRPPAEDFLVYVLDGEQNVVQELRFPYSTFARGDEKWHTLKVDSFEVPEQFGIALNFNAERTKGVYVGKDTDVDESHSLIGRPDQGFRPVAEGYDWMIRVHLAPTKRDEAPTR